MISVEEKETLLNNLKCCSLNSYTIECIIRYADISTDIFNIDHNILIKNISNNIKKDIVFKKKYHLFSSVLGSYNFKSKQIMISPKLKNKQHIISIIFHELDHAASSQYIKSESINEYLSTYVRRLNNKHPILFKIPFVKYILKKRFLRLNSLSSGFNNTLAGKALGIDLNLFKEGITTYKQSKYEQYLHLSDRITTQENNYKNEMKVAQLIIDIIGEERTMKLEQNNDILGLKTIFEKITNKQVLFEDLIQQLNNTSIESRRILENQKELNATMQKIILCKKAYDYNIDIGNSNLSLAEIQNIITSYEKNLKFKNDVKSCNSQKTCIRNKDFYTAKDIEDYYNK